MSTLDRYTADALDRHITGNYGADQPTDDEEMEQEAIREQVGVTSDDAALVVARIRTEILPVHGMAAFREDPGGMLAYHGFDEPDDVCAAAIRSVLDDEDADEVEDAARADADADYIAGRTLTRYDEAGFRTAVPRKVGGLTILAVSRWKSGGVGFFASAVAVAEGDAGGFSTHIVVYDDERDHWSVQIGHYTFPNRAEADADAAARVHW